MPVIRGDISCDCDVCPCSAPRRFRLTVSGFQPCGDNPCLDCSDLDGEYILETVGGCAWACEGTHPCTGAAISWHLFISRNDDCTLQMEVYFGGGKPKPWTGTVDHCWPDATVLTGGQECWPDLGPQCEFPDSLTVEPIGVHSLEGTECLEQRSCPHLILAREPSLGLSVCGFDVDCCCTCRPEQSPTIPGVEVCPAECGGVGGFCPLGLNPNNGNVSVQVGMPHAGAMAPADTLTYNSRWGGPSSYGYGVFGMYGMHVEAVAGGCDARLYRCDGSVYCFSSKAADGTYRYVPPGAPSELKRTATGWVEHEPGRNTYTYDNSGQVVSIQNPCGEIWTLTHSSPLSSIADPYGRLTTYVYDASSKLQRIVDVHGRSTTFVVDSNGNLTKRISPELCITELVYGTSYDDLHQLKAVIAPDGARTSLSYDTNGWIRKV